MKQTQLVQSLFLTSVCRGVTAAGTLALNVCLARTLPVEECGRIFFCLTTTITLAIVARFGFDSSLLRFGGKAWHAGQRTLFQRTSKTAITIVAVSSLVVAGLGQLAMLFAGSWHGQTTMQRLLFSIPFLALCYVISASFKAATWPELGALFEIGGASLIVAIAIYFLDQSGTEWSAESAALAFTFTAGLFCASGFVLLRLLLWRPEPPETTNKEVDTKELVWASSDFAIAAYAQVLGTWGSVLFIEYFCGSSSVAFFTAALRIILVPRLLLTAIVAVCSPKIAGLHADNDSTSLRDLVRRSSMIIFLVSFPFLLTVGLAAPWCMSFFGPEYRDYWYLLLILACGEGLNTVVAMGPIALGMSGFHGLVKRIGVVSSVVSFLLSGVLVATFGVKGAAIGFAGYATCQALAMAIGAKHQLGFYPVPAKSLRW